MERTELREQFFAEMRRDPYSYAIQNLVARAWAGGYEQALRDAIGHLSVSTGGYLDRLRDLLLRESSSDRHQRALAHMTEDRRKAEAELIVALGTMGEKLTPPSPGA